MTANDVDDRACSELRQVVCADYDIVEFRQHIVEAKFVFDQIVEGVGSNQEKESHPSLN